jgi:hypothetical protein
VALNLIGGLIKGGASLFRTFWRLARQLFHETTGALFAFFAFAGASTSWRAWHQGAEHWIVALPLGFAVMMSWFAVSAFRSARRVR